MAEIDPDNLDFEMSPTKSMVGRTVRRMAAARAETALARPLSPTVLDALVVYIHRHHSPKEVAIMYLSQLGSHDLMDLVTEVLQDNIEQAAQGQVIEPE